MSDRIYKFTDIQNKIDNRAFLTPFFDHAYEFG